LRLAELEKTIDIYLNYCKILNKEEDIRVISAAKLSKEDKVRVVDSLKKNKPGIRFKVTYEEDPAILGGLQIFAGSEFLDCSLRSRMERLKSELSRIA
jgi:F0F1-type ATP synthase delta subunit